MGTFGRNITTAILPMYSRFKVKWPNESWLNLKRSSRPRRKRPSSKSQPLTLLLQLAPGPIVRTQIRAGLGVMPAFDHSEISNAENPGNCWHGNTDPAGVTSDPALIQTTHGTCGKPNSGEPLTSPLGAQVACATGFGASLVSAFPPCPGGATGYPQQDNVVNLIPLPHEQSMPNPCAGAPDNAWCSRGKPRAAAKTHGRRTADRT